jgi:hypothetical protein
MKFREKKMKILSIRIVENGVTGEKPPQAKLRGDHF